METENGRKNRIGLVLEGGAMRGIFTCGVLDVFMENGITFDGVCGISAGAAFGCNYKSGQIGRALRYNKKYAGDPRYCSFRSLITTGDMYGVDFCYRKLINELDPFDREAYRANPMEFYVAAVDVRTGEPVYHQCKDGSDEDITWMRASASMPLVSRPVEIGGHLLLDGGIVDSIPYAYMEQLGYERNVIILTQPEGYLKKKASAMPLFRIMLRRYPKIAEAMAVRHERYNQQTAGIREREKAGTVFVIRPPEDLKISRTEKDPDELERIYQIGRSEAVSRLPEMEEFIRKSHTVPSERKASL
ncbi:MAG: patatin family protein [Anaerolineaceae bacterium]|nr:patatin family protein [Anaerolineaceae bacterium]